MTNGNFGFSLEWLGVTLKSFWGTVGWLWRHFGMAWGHIGVTLADTLVALASIRGDLGALWSLFGQTTAILGQLGSFWAYFGRSLGRLWGHLGAFLWYGGAFGTPWDNFLACEDDPGIIITSSGMHESELEEKQISEWILMILHKQLNEFWWLWGYFYQHGTDLGVV